MVAALTLECEILFQLWAWAQTTYEVGDFDRRSRARNFSAWSFTWSSQYSSTCNWLHVDRLAHNN